LMSFIKKYILSIITSKHLPASPWSMTNYIQTQQANPWAKLYFIVGLYTYIAQI
jgi:hypothetical protein